MRPMALIMDTPWDRERRAQEKRRALVWSAICGALIGFWILWELFA